MRINPYLVFLILVNSIIYNQWLSFSIFTFSDWLFHFKDALRDLIIPTVWNSTWAFGFGHVDIILWKLPVYVLTGIFGVAGFDYNVAEKFIVFWPIIFGLSTGSFFLVRHIVKSDLGALVGSFIFAFSTYFLSIDTQGHHFLTAAFAFATFAILFFIRLLEERKFYLSVLTGLLLFLVGSYDLRALYITAGILVLYLIYYVFIFGNNFKKEKIKFLALALSPFILLILLSLYWLLPILVVDAFRNNSTLGRQIFGSEFYNIQSSLTTFFPFWTGKETAWFTVQKIPLYFWFYPILAIVGLTYNRKNTKIVFFALIALIGLFFSKQTDVPFSHVYSWLYQHIPGFNAFREASKFNFMVSLGYAVMIGGLVQYLGTRNLRGWLFYAKHVIVIAIASLALWNTKPIITGDIKSLFIERTIPRNFVHLKEYILTQPEYFRTFWINMSNHWLPFNNNHPQIEGVAMMKSDWYPFAKESLLNRNKSEGEKLVTILRQNNTNKLLDLASVKYIIIPLYDKGMGENIESYFGKNHKYYREEIGKIKYLKKVTDFSPDILVFENSDYRPHTYITTQEEQLANPLPYRKVGAFDISPSEYKINIKKANGPFYLNFTENYHPSWKVRVGKFAPINVLFDTQYFLNEAIHSRSEAGFNSFFIDPRVTCKLYKCDLNEDGSYNLELTLFFKPQSYLYLGMILSGSTLLLMLVYISYYAFKTIKKQH